MLSMNEAPPSGNKYGKYYRLFVVVQAMILLAFFGLKNAVPRDRDGARVPKAFSDINGSLKSALEIFKKDCGRYPTTQEGWGILLSAPTNGSLTNWHGPYLDENFGAPIDPWDRPYVYRYPAVHSTNAYDVSSLGPDGVEDSPDDIGNWAEASVPTSATIASWLDRNEGWLLTIPVFFMIGMLAQLTFPNLRSAARENPWADWLWFAIALVT